MLWAQWMMLVLYAMVLGGDLAKFGREKKLTRTRWGWEDVVITLIAFGMLTLAGGMNLILGWPK